MTSTQIPTRGDKVTGTYFGVPFTGTVYEARWHTLNDSRITHVNLDAPITVYGRERESLAVTTDGNGDDWSHEPCGNSLRKAEVADHNGGS